MLTARFVIFIEKDKKIPGKSRDFLFSGRGLHLMLLDVEPCSMRRTAAAGGLSYTIVDKAFLDYFFCYFIAVYLVCSVFDLAP